MQDLIRYYWRMAGVYPDQSGDSVVVQILLVLLSRYSRCVSSFSCCSLQNSCLTWPRKTFVNSVHRRLIGPGWQLVPPSFAEFILQLQDAANLRQAAGVKATATTISELLPDTNRTYSVLQVIWASKKKLLKIQKIIKNFKNAIKSNLISR